MAEYIDFETEEEQGEDYDSGEEDEVVEEMSDFLDDTVYDDKGLPPNPYLTEPVKYPRGLERVIRKVFLL